MGTNKYIEAWRRKRQGQSASRSVAPSRPIPPAHASASPLTFREVNVEEETTPLERPKPSTQPPPKGGGKSR